METRKLAIAELKSFISESERRIKSLLDSIGWSKESVQHANGIKQKDGVEEAKAELNSHDTFPASFQATNSSSCIRLDNLKQAEAILEDVYLNSSFELGVPLEELVNRNPPSNLEDLHVNFTRDERLSLYNHVLKNTTKPPDVPEIKIRFKRDAQSEEKVASLTEIAAMERDARRRNPKHRVSKKPLTYKEEVRHLIQVQTDALAHHFRQSSHTKQGNVKSNGKKSKLARKSRSHSPDPERSHKKKKRHRSRSRERSQSRERKRHKSHKKHKKSHKR
ncbi:nuclear speckle splicing regulatory protein 1-like [Anopheles moucheti]|uniref:nuclear speckle splicing regulatory protein 1-like n=1 Tax=Anopheles moucheti TaxID=186751 RepID=UPI0022EFE159|nr:nuclear speckle splicing regulatory protein 1-like [Anopheles moucheti]